MYGEIDKFAVYSERNWLSLFMVMIDKISDENRSYLAYTQPTRKQTDQILNTLRLDWFLCLLCLFSLIVAFLCWFVHYKTQYMTQIEIDHSSLGLFFLSCFHRPFHRETERIAKILWNQTTKMKITRPFHKLNFVRILGNTMRVKFSRHFRVSGAQLQAFWPFFEANAKGMKLKYSIQIFHGNKRR